MHTGAFNMPSIPLVNSYIPSSLIQELLLLASDMPNRIRATTTWQVNVREELYCYAELTHLRDSLFLALGQAPYAVAIRGLPFRIFPSELEPWGIILVFLLLCSVSDGNAYAERSGLYWEHVQPSRLNSTDVTYTMGECEAHSDESSKPEPEDIVGLWCVQPASEGGTSRVWTVHDIEMRLQRTPEGRQAIRVLRERWFPFGGKLRQPPRTLLAPVLIGREGIRYRAGAIADGYASLGRSPTSLGMEALDLLAAAIRDTTPFEHDLKAGDLLLLLNRRTIHARSDFCDCRRHLIKVRGFSEHFAVSDAGLPATWSDSHAAPILSLLA
jgi:hypothetical protein